MQLSPSLTAWIEGLTGTTLAEVQELTGGASRNSYILTGTDGSKAFLRQDGGHGPLSGTVFTLAREYGVLAFLQGKGVPIARTLGFSAAHNAILMAFVPGHTTYQKLGTPAEEADLQRQLMTALVSLQRIDPAGLDALGPAVGLPMAEAIRADLAIWRGLYQERVSPRDPVLEFTLNWLAAAVPDPGARPVLVHGDIGPGNFLIRDGRIQALIDWEMVRAGHPLEDVACIIARSLGAPFGEAGFHIRTYEQLTGAPVDLRKLDYALVLVLTRWQIAINGALSAPSAEQNVPMLFAFRQINNLALVDALCRCHGLPEDDEPPVELRPRTPPRAALDYARAYLQQLAGQDDTGPADRYKLGGVGDLLSYLQSFIEYGPDRYEAEDVARTGRLLGRDLPDAAAANRALCDHAAGATGADATALVAHLRWRTRREHAIMRRSLNERADNAISY